ncbi:MAG: DNA polymerase I [Desulfovibrionaceae bacterium]|nr:DNA polymerase I [Desulfovibrionaceae bacterium]
MSLKQRLGFTKEPLYLMDGTAFLYRGFFANAAMSRSDGVPTGAIYSVGRVLLKLLKEEMPTLFAFLLDGRGTHFRHEIFPAYKANRPPAPDALTSQVEPVRRMAAALGLHVEVADGCEADDCIASLAHRFRAERPVVIIGMDKDLRQCLADNVVLWDPSARDEKLVTLRGFQEETGLTPGQWPDVQALVGDSSDNVPGVRGIGPKTAEALFRDFANLEDLRDRCDQAPAAVRKKLDGNLDAMFLYRRLTTLDLGRCAGLTPDDLRVRPLPGRAALTLFREFEMGSLHRELSELIRRGVVRAEGGPADAGSLAPAQLSLLGCAAPAPETPKTRDTADLPPCAGRTLALTPPPDAPREAAGQAGFSVAVAAADGAGDSGKADEWRYLGPADALAAWAASASTVVAPDVKRLMREDEVWETVSPDLWFDLGLAAYLLAPEERDYGWPRLSALHAEHSGLPQERPAALALSLHADLLTRLERAGLLPLMKRMELPLIPVLAHMERAGVGVDVRALHAFLDEVQASLDQLSARIYEEAGGEFNIRSAQQIGEVLFKRLGLPAARATRGGQASTSQDVLEKLSGHHPVVDTLLEFRKLEKLRSTYLEPLPRLTGADGRIRSTFNQLATATGRLSSSNPNLQNIPVRGDLGRRMRSCFIAAPGKVLVAADYSQVELRVLAHYSQDATLLAGFREGEDIHTRTAALLNGIDASAVTPDQRRGAKTINFGLIYGMGERKLAQELGMALAEARAFMERYFAHFSHIKEFYDDVEQQARERGYVTTLAGRRRPLPDMRSQSAASRAQAERQAVNTLIQGSAADIIKLAMLAVHGDEELRGLSARLILQVHDELVLEAPEAHAGAVGRRVAELMTMRRVGGTELSVPLAVDWGYGPDWGIAH